MWHQRASLTYPRFRTRCTQHTWHGRSRLTGPPRGGHLMISPLCICRRCGRDGCRGRCRKACMRGTKARWGRVKFRVMFHKSGKKFGKFRKFCFRKQAAGGFRRRGPTRRAFARCVRCRCTGFFSAVGRACLARHGAALIVGLAAPRRPRRQPRRLQLLVLGLRLPAASCLVGVALQPHIVAAWRRPPRGAPAGPRCPGRMRSGRPFKVADACCGLVHAQRPSGEYGLRGVARAFLCV